jgi:membrane-associated phospholipid phosphatase
VAASAPAVYRARQRLSLPPALTTGWLFAAPLTIANGFRPSFGRDAAVWASQMWAYKNAFELPSDRGKRHRQRAHVDYPLRLDTWLGLGMPPSQRLQRALRPRSRFPGAYLVGRRRKLTRLDKALALFYLTWELEPHLAMAWIRRRDPDAFPAAAGRLALTFDSTLIGYWALPTAPPWWASEKEGRMNREVRRVMMEVVRWLKGRANPRGGDHAAETNNFASMPSDHFGSAAMTAMLLSEQEPAAGVFGWAYALLLGFTLVYLGEHYVTDLLAGLALATAINASRPVVERVAQALLGPPPDRAD